MAHSICPEDFFRQTTPILDVRSPAEYILGHVPDALCFPLFTDQERVQVGTCYKLQGRNQAVELGFEIAGPKFAQFIAQAQELAPERRIRLYCWRGGMRSEAVGWVLEMAGFQVSLLQGGYKAFRHWGQSLFEQPQNIIILGGMTGTGKTEVLQALKKLGEQTLDLEALANHRGSSYGALGQPPQPTNEQFWNLITVQWSQLDRQRPVWIEAESKRIGLCRIPESLFLRMEQAPVAEIQRPRAERLNLLVKVYGEFTVEDLVKATERIRKRLGGLNTQIAVELLNQGNLLEAFDLILQYYDKTYSYDLKRRSVPIYPINVEQCNASEVAQQLQALIQTMPTLLEKIVLGKEQRIL
ncbi:MAG: tRNA 2-selenouridine(34) synthase MnmH [Microcoleaceae cyanobacterium]